MLELQFSFHASGGPGIVAPSRYKKVDNHYDYQPFLFSIQPNARLNMSSSRQERFYYKAILNLIVHTHILQEYF